MTFFARHHPGTHDTCWPPQDRLRAVLCDRDGTLIDDHPYSGDPDLVTPMPGVIDGLKRLRSRGLAIGLVTNQSAVARGLITLNDVRAVNTRVAELVGPFDAVAVCTHQASDRCRCRKPAPGMIRAVARALGLPTRQCVVVGNSGVDIGAARHAGAAGILLSPATLWPFDDSSPEEEHSDGYTVGSFMEATSRILEFV